MILALLIGKGEANDTKADNASNTESVEITRSVSHGVLVSPEPVVGSLSPGVPVPPRVDPVTPEPERARPVDTPPPVESGATLGYIEQITCSYSWEPFTCGQINNVWACESGRDMAGNLDGAWASNGISYGVAQLVDIGGRFSGFWDVDGNGVPGWASPERNIRWAHDLFQEQGIRPWSCAYAAG